MEKRIFVSHKTFGIGYLLEKERNQGIIDVCFNKQLKKINNLDGLENNKYLILFNDNFSNYIIPTSMDMPNIKTYFVEENESTGPFGAKGLGEPVMLPTAPAILNAIYDAIGVRFYELPVTCEKVLASLKRK